VRIEIFVLIIVELLTVPFVIVKLDGYPIPAQNPTGMDIDTNFYQQIQVRV
jgi:hypothetical protein